MPKHASPPPTPLAANATAPPAIDREAAGVELRLAIGRDGLGLELNRPARVGCVDVTEIAVALSGVRFPLDVSGGVSRFRHKRGELRRLAIEVTARSLAAWAAPKLRGLVSTESPDVWIAVRKDAATIGIAAGDEPKVLAFDVTMDVHEGDVRLSVTRARGTGLGAPATALAIAAVRAVVGDVATREGGRFVIGRAIARIAKALLPEAGARAPSAEGMRWSATAAHGDAWILHASDGAPAEVSEEAARAREAAAIARHGDDARVAGDLARARALDLAALERAPRHAALAARVAEIDALAGGRAEAALAMLSEADADGGAARGAGRSTPEAGAAGDARGALYAELLAESGDARGAIAAFARTGDTEAVPALAAIAYERAAVLVDGRSARRAGWSTPGDPHDALVWLDLAIGRAPAIARLRWARAAQRLRAGRIEDALADVEHVEALATGARAKHAVWRRAGETWRAAGLVAESATLFERALKYAPDDPTAVAGLGAALVEARRAARGAALLARAIELAEARAEDTSAMTIDLARALADALGDRPAAIARVRAVPNGADDAIVARGLEARWRAAIGDHAGASLAWARVRDLATATVDAPDDAAKKERAARLLHEAAAFERDARGDLATAQRHLGTALRLRPHDAELQVAYREVCGKIAPAIAASAAAAAPAAAAAAVAELDDDAAAVRVEELTRVLQGDPTRDDVVDELAALLVRLGRGLELLALLSARLEDAPEDRRAQLLPQQRAVLARLEKEAREAGRASEASLFRDALAALD